MSLDWDEYERWMKQAKHTLDSINADLKHGRHEWACFKAHQVAEYSLKALLGGAGEPAFGHDLRDLLEKAKRHCDLKLEGGISRLSEFYIPTSYQCISLEGLIRVLHKGRGRRVPETG